MKKWLYFTLATGMIACRPELKPEAVDPGSTNVSNFIVIGDDYLSGYQDGSLFLDGQIRSVGVLIHQSLKEGGAGSFVQCLMPDNEGLGINSKPWESTYVSSSKLRNRTDCEGVTSLGPVKTLYTSGQHSIYLIPTAYSAIHDLSIPFATSSDFLATDLHLRNPYFYKYSGSFGNASPKEIAHDQMPTFFASWIGMENIFSYARNGGYNQTIISPAQFASDLDSVFTALTMHGAKGVVATIPDFRLMPYYTLVPWNGAHLEQEDADSLSSIYASAGMNHISFQAGNNGFVIEDAGAPLGYRQLINGEYITLSVPLDSMKCYYYGIMVNVLHDRYVLDSAEVAVIDDHIAQYNTIIRQKAAQYGLALADIANWMPNLESGVQWNGITYTPEFVSGAFFSLDGFHPTQKGANLIANQFISAINAAYGSTYPTIYCEDCNGVLFP